LRNPGAGGWAAVLLYKEHRKEISGGEANSTNNRMEMLAVIEALKTVKKSDAEILIYTDSKYVMEGITKWIFNWKKNNWKTADKKPVKNLELWQALDAETSKHRIKWQWVKGHSGNHFNEIVDELAKKAAQAINNF